MTNGRFRRKRARDHETVEALSGPSKPKWQEAMEKEMESLYCNDVWELVELPKDPKAVGSKWVFKVNSDADGSVERYKARLVGQGYTQKFRTNSALWLESSL